MPAEVFWDFFQICVREGREEIIELAVTLQVDNFVRVRIIRASQRQKDEKDKHIAPKQAYSVVAREMQQLVQNYSLGSFREEVETVSW